MSKELKPGDDVIWNSSQGNVEGTVERRVTSPTKVKGHTAKASADQPQYLVKSAKTGKEAIHKPSSLKKAKRAED